MPASPHFASPPGRPRRILIAAGGSRGDIQPMLALALALRARGHTIRFCAPPNFEGWVGSHGLAYQVLGRDTQAFLAAAGLDVHKALSALKDDLRREFAVLGGLAREADVIVGASVTCAGVSYAEKLGIPYAYVVFSPSLLPSGRHPAPTCKSQRLPRWLNRLTWWGLRWGWNGLFRRVLNDERRKLGLAPVPDVYRHIQDAPLLVAAEPALAGLAEDAPARVTQPGALFLPEPEGLSPELDRFLDDGPAPVYIGFGSMTDRNPARSTATLLAAIQDAGVRAVIGRGWAGLGEAPLPPGVLVVDAVPHSKLFPRVAAVVHHGGAGTTANAARAGVPQVLVPHIVDQFFWADRVARLGLGPPAIPRRRLDRRRLAAALRSCDESRYREQARALAPRMSLDGVERAVAQVEGM